MTETNNQKYRLVTRSDFDGLVCAMLLKELDLIDDILFVHPKDMQDGKVPITALDICTNLPYVEGCHLTFDHHDSEIMRAGGIQMANHIIESSAPSAARVVYNYYGGASTFKRITNELMEAVDKGDSANFTREEVLQPSGWNFLNYLMDARTGLGRFRDFRISNYQLMMQLIDLCLDHPIEYILNTPDVKERVDLYLEHAVLFEEQIKRCAQVHGKVVVLDLRKEETIYAGNRFMIYALFPECNISIHVMWGLKQQNTVLAIGKSILNKSAKTHIGELCLKYNGGGHRAAGTCQVSNDNAEEQLTHILEQIQKDG